jgi:hypothetical protein
VWVKEKRTVPCDFYCRRTAVSATRQTCTAHGNVYCTAKPQQRTAKVARSAKLLPCDFRATHGEDGFAELNVAERSLPCTAARQRLCRAEFDLCRAI